VTQLYTAVNRRQSKAHANPRALLCRGHGTHTGGKPRGFSDNQNWVTRRNPRVPGLALQI